MTSDDSRPKFIKKDYRVWNALGQAALNQIISTADQVVRTEIVCEPNDQVVDQVNVTSAKAQSDTTTNYDQENSQVTNFINLDDSDDTKQLDQLSRKELTELISKLTGLQEKLFYLVLLCCRNNNNLQTMNLKTIDIAELIQCKQTTTKNAITRIVDKKLIQRLSGKTSRNGFVRFSITKEVKKAGDTLATNKKVTDAEFKQFLTKVRQRLINISKKT